jgi:hypothetical protein
MSYQISYTSVLYTKWPQNSIFTGSSKHRIVDGELLTINRNNVKKKAKRRTKKVSDETLPVEPSGHERHKIIYKLNKSKVRKKCNAFSRLEKSKKFLAFYSISFPKGLPDENAYKIFNIWLTRCRKDCGLKSYIWVAERQKNGTVHFHLLSNDFMQIQTVNGFMASCLSSEKKNGLEALKWVKIEKYNGVDVKKVDKNRKSLIGYLTKYITKNEIEFTHLPWHCSRDVSRLFTKVNFDTAERDKYFDQIPDSVEKYNVFITDNYKVAGFKFRPSDNIFSELDSVNELLYSE